MRGWAGVGRVAQHLALCVAADKDGAAGANGSRPKRRHLPSLRSAAAAARRWSDGRRAHSWKKSRRVAAKVEWHPGELYSRVGFIVTNLARPAERVVAFYNQSGACEQFIKEGIKWKRLSCRAFAANAVRPQLHALAYRLVNDHGSAVFGIAKVRMKLPGLREKLIKIGAKVVSDGRDVTFQMAEVAAPRRMFAEIMSLTARLRAPPASA